MKPLDEIDFALDDLPGRELHDALAGFRSRGPVVRTKFVGMPAWIIADYQALASAFRDSEVFPPHRTYEIGIEGVVGRTFISMEGREHLTFRKLAMPAFRSRAVEQYERDGLAELAHELVDRLEKVSAPDLVADFAARFPYLVITRVLGLPRTREDEFHDWAHALLRFRDDAARAKAAEAELTSVLAPIVESRRSEPLGDVISELVQAEADGRRLTDEEIHAHVRLLFPTGGETTHGTLGNLLFAVLTEPGVWDQLVAQPSRVEAAVDEILRWESSIAVLPRMTASQPVSFCGTELPADEWVLFGIAGANRDPRVFPDPDRFDLDRSVGEALTFGPGVKSCPGMHLARKNLTVALQVLVERLPGLRLLERESALPRRAVLRSPDELRVAW